MWRTYPVTEEFTDARIDAAIARLTGLSRAEVQRLIDTGDVLLDGNPVAKSVRLRAQSILEINIPTPRTVAPRGGDVTIPILYEDGDLVVVDKPAGLAAHPSLNFTGPDVLGALMNAGVQLSAYGPAERKGIVHRLDVGTSGCMVVAKSERAYVLLKDEFRQRVPEKIYHALVQGHPDPLSGTVDAPIGRDPRHQWKMGVRADGRHSVTHYDTLEAMAGGSLLQVHLETGRTHQIRVHMSALGHPCVGDATYGADPGLSETLGLTRQWLHATHLGFEHPDGSWREFEAPYPADLATALERMRAGVFS
ncbi:RluA family pseudouridine synthase [Actinotignum sp. GS-2025c]|uniref:RluA family pseudouridine synthase n=1 Tax=Actinotignum TaxID=1653174 RepID=UPI000F7D5D31|nr:MULTISPECIES: RluA family pseudouridine synthase [Actinotignum]MDE1535672.1 RluA family pseudouridine synthase [Actinotignum schaalii]MDY5148533.1 RluA family pseudouridine synthase [Actinotignum sanguinis]RTE51425.1 RNA pseudouridine synthase [Actinotignum sanguinis]